MSKCENCIHYEVCVFNSLHIDENENECNYYKDKSLCVELPCRCKDCEFFYNNGVLQLCRYWNGHATTEWNYCSYAKLKEIEG